MVDKSVKVGLQADATQAVRSVNDVAAAITPVLTGLLALEERLASITTGKLPGGMKEIRAYIKQLNTLATALSNINPNTTLKRAAMQGQMAPLRTDAARQILEYDKEVNKVLAAREEIYRRLKAANPDASRSALLGQYRSTLAGAGEATPRGWKAATAREAAQFEQNLNSQVVASKVKAEEAAFRYIQSVKIRGFQAEQRQQEKTQEWLHNIRMRYFRDEQRKQETEDKRKEREAIKQAQFAHRWSPAGVNERVGQSFTMANARTRYMGGAPLMAQRMDFMRDYMVMGAGITAAAFTARSVIELQTALKNTQAISKATNKEMESLTKTVFQVGQTTKFAVREIAEAATVMAQAGYSANQIKEALPAIAQLATGAGASIQEAVNIVTSVLTVYDMSIERTAKVSNQLAEALNGSKLNLQQLSLGVQYAGNIAADSGVQFDELTAALGAMSNAGIKSGSTLGTGMRALIQELENPSQKFRESLEAVGLTVQDVDIKSQGLGGALKTLSASGFTSAQAMEVFELRAAAAYSAIENNLDSYDQQLDALQNTAAATAAAATQMGTFSAQMSRLGNAVVQFTSEAAAPFIGALTAIIGGFATLISIIPGGSFAIQGLTAVLLTLMAINSLKWLAGMAAGFAEMRIEARAAAAEVATLNKVNMTNMLSNLKLIGTTLATSVVTGFKAAGAAVVAFGRFLLLTPLGWLTLALTGVVWLLGRKEAALKKLNKEIDLYKTQANDAGAKAKMYGDRVSEINTYMDKLVNRYERLKKPGQEFNDELQRGIANFGAWSDQIDGSIKTIDKFIDRLVKMRTEMHEMELAQLQVEDAALRREQDALKRKNDTHFKDIKGKVAPLTGNTDFMQRLFGNSNVVGLLNRLGKGEQLSYNELQLLAGKLSAVAGNVTKSQSANPQATSKYLMELVAMLNNPDFAEYNGVTTQIQGNQRALSNAAILTTPQATQVGEAIGKAATALIERQQTAMRIKDPEQRARELAQIRKDAIVKRQELTGNLNAQAAGIFDSDPNIASTYTQAASRYLGTGASAEAVRERALKMVVEQLVRDNPALSNIMVLAGDPTASNNVNVLQSMEANTNALLKKAKQDRDKALITQLTAELDLIKKRIYAVQHPDEDPLNTTAVFGNTEGTDTTNHAFEQEQQDRTTARIKATELQRRMAALDKKIAGQAAQTSALVAQTEDALTVSTATAKVMGIAPDARITSDHRTKAQNEAVGGATNSWHLTGQALDIAPISGMTFEQFREKLKGLGVPITELLNEGDHWHWAWGAKTPALAGGSGTPQFNQDALKASLNEWVTTGRDRVRQEGIAGGLKEDEIKDRMADFDVTAAEYVSKVLSGNLQDAKEYLAYRSGQSAENNSANLISQLAAVGGDLQGALSSIASANSKALEDAISAAEQKFRTDNPMVTNLENAQEWLKERDKITAEWATKTVQNSLAAIDAFYARDLANQDAKYAALTAERGKELARIGALSNPWGNRNLGDVQRALGGLRTEQLQGDSLRQNVNQIRDRMATNSGKVGQLETQLSSLDPKRDAANFAEVQNNLAAAKDEATQLATALIEAENALLEATGEMPAFTSMTQAAAAAWSAFQQSNGVGKSIFEEVADGLYSTFGAVSNGMSTLVKDVLSGTKTMSQAFKDFALSILESMLDMASKMIANKVLTMIIQWIGQMFGGVFTGGGLGQGSTSGMDNVGVRSVANGGMPAGRFANGGMQRALPSALIAGGVANRDSVHTLTMPGEVIMNRSAVEMLGADTLLNLNSMGNRRVGEIKSYAPPPKREPDQVNVWVVAPDQKPQLGKKDILAVIGDDIQTGGATKKLIKAVMVGGV